MSSNRKHADWCVHSALGWAVFVGLLFACPVDDRSLLGWLWCGGWTLIACVCVLRGWWDGASPWLRLKNEDGPYLTRWCLICTPYGRLYVHRIHAPDAAPREVHNHPADWRCLILWGGYVQHMLRPLFHSTYGPYLKVPITDWRGKHQAQRWVERKDWLAVNHMTTDVYHRIAVVKPNTWTLCWFGKQKPEGWGFWCNGVHVPNEKYRAHKAAQGEPLKDGAA